MFVGQLTPSNLLDFISSLSDWHSLGLCLRLSTDILQEIKHSCSTITQAKAQLVTQWLHNDPAASWEKFAEALKDIGEAQLSQDVLKEYCSGKMRVCLDFL